MYLDDRTETEFNNATERAALLDSLTARGLSVGRLTEVYGVGPVGEVTRADGSVAGSLILGDYSNGKGVMLLTLLPTPAPAPVCENGYSWTFKGESLVELNDDKYESGGQTAYVFERNCVSADYLRALAIACGAAAKAIDGK